MQASIRELTSHQLILLPQEHNFTPNVNCFVDLLLHDVAHYLDYLLSTTTKDSIPSLLLLTLLDSHGEQTSHCGSCYI